MSDAARPARTVRCPACAGPAVYAPQNPWRPFCSERCRQHDLGAWASESYRVAASPPPEDDPDAAPPGTH
ncbi:MAG: DNA gyrase inhibitor YacG [Rubrivivax sp.]|nr:DNA gyrase inhibitor YacG [Rubrivivax sp.]